MPSLVEKLADIAKTVPNLLKEGDNGTYKFIRAVDAFDAIRIKLFEAGIVIFPTGHKVTRSKPYETARGDMTDEVIGEFKFTISDGTQYLECTAPGVGQDYQGKAFYMASTGAKKDLIKTIFLIAGYEDDAESIQDTAPVSPDLAAKIAENEKKFGTDINEWPIERTDVNAWCSAARTTGFHMTAQKAFLKSRGVAKISDLKRKDLQLAMDWALGKDVPIGESSSSPDEESIE